MPYSCTHMATVGIKGLKSWTWSGTFQCRSRSWSSRSWSWSWTIKCWSHGHGLERLSLGSKAGISSGRRVILSYGSSWQTFQQSSADVLLESTRTRWWSGRRMESQSRDSTSPGGVRNASRSTSVTDWCSTVSRRKMKDITDASLTSSSPPSTTLKVRTIHKGTVFWGGGD